MNIPHCTGCGEYPGEYVADEIETLRKRIAELDIDVAAWTNTAHILDSRAEKAKARIAELERSNDNLRQIERNVQAVREHDFQRAEKAEAAISEARARLAAADRMAEALELVLKRCGPRATDGEIGRSALQAYRKETGHDE